MTTREDILERLAYADALGHGPQTSALIAEAVSWADALGDEDLRIATRLALTEAYQQGNEEWKALEPFVWNLARYQRRPELFDDAQVRTLHWHFKRAVAVAAANPKVSKDKVRQLEASLEEFYRAGAPPCTSSTASAPRSPACWGLRRRLPRSWPWPPPCPR